MSENIEENVILNEERVIIKRKEILVQKVKECDSFSFKNFLEAKFLSCFLDLQELNEFILFLNENKGEFDVSDIYKNFKEILNEFRECKTRLS